MPSSTPPGDPVQGVHAYHTLSKHTPHRSAPGPGYMDWESQPNPFRTFAGAPQVALPLGGDRLHTPHAALYHSVGQSPPHPLGRESIATFLELSLGLAAWKAYLDEWWALRCNPSSGNLHPTEGYLIVPGIAGPPGNTLEAGVYHYLSRDHLLEQRWAPQTEQQRLWEQGFAPGTFLLGLSSIHWREAWKYGLRAYRYCQLDVGHAAAALRYAAAALGWQAEIVTEAADADLAHLMALTATQEPADPEAEHPDLLLLIRTTPTPVTTAPTVDCSVAALAAQVADGPWLGQANRLSPLHRHAWPEIDQVAQATWKGHTPAENGLAAPLPPLEPGHPDLPAARLIRQRRSAQRYDGHTHLGKAAFFRILDACLPRPHASPWDLRPGTPRIHLLLMLHRVTDLAPGLYALPRREEALPLLQRALQATFPWERVAEAPAHLPLYRLAQGDLRGVAQQLSCRQEIAADGAFSLGMLGEFTAALAQQGAWAYRSLFWEAGMLGQTLYLEAEAEGIRGTGIGCYFDDTFHQLLGLQGEAWQSLYHFTVGGPLVDNRLQSRPAYHHLQGRI
ncbi:MAG: SagB/ThcOx family dehydrogenase [Magnetococcales bacterium]|nr:SagB/ThcOx family dehydrogenase [Magnetococcales bacterium]